MKKTTKVFSETSNEDRRSLLNRYLRRTACSAAAGLSAFGAASTDADAAVIVVDPVDFGIQGGGFGWVTGTPVAYNGQSFGIDILQDGGTLDIGIFRGGGYYGYLIGRTDTVGYATPYGSISGSGQVRIVSNDNELPDTGPVPGGGQQGSATVSSGAGYR